MRLRDLHAHTAVPVHVHDRSPPQPSSNTPHWSGCELQSAGAHAHWLPLHVCPAGQVSQSSVALQPSEAMPQDAASRLQVLGVHVLVPHLLGPPPPQFCPGGHEPHVTTEPQPSGAAPQDAPRAAQVAGVHPV
jgi:hypothetical protein